MNKIPNFLTSYFCKKKKEIPHPNNPTGVDFFLTLTSKYDNPSCRMDWDTLLEVISQCACKRVLVCIFLSFSIWAQSVTNGCVRAWWSTAIALLGTKLLQDYIDSPKKTPVSINHTWSVGEKKEMSYRWQIHRRKIKYLILKKKTCLGCAFYINLVGTTV